MYDQEHNRARIEGKTATASLYRSHIVLDTVPGSVGRCLGP